MKISFAVSFDVNTVGLSMCDVDIHGRIDGKGSDGVIFDILARVDYCMNYHTNACAVERGLGETPNLEGGSRAGEFQNHASTYVIGTRTETLVAVTSIACSVPVPVACDIQPHPISVQRAPYIERHLLAHVDPGPRRNVPNQWPTSTQSTSSLPVARVLK